MAGGGRCGFKKLYALWRQTRTRSLVQSAVRPAAALTPGRRGTHVFSGAHEKGTLEKAMSRAEEGLFWEGPEGGQPGGPGDVEAPQLRLDFECWMSH